MRQLALRVPMLPWLADLPVAFRGTLLTKLTSCHAALPYAWTQAVGQVPGAPPLEAFWDVAWTALGWRVGTSMNGWCWMESPLQLWRATAEQ